MTTINVSEADFQAAFSGAHACRDSGDEEGAKGLDKRARKINASLAQKTARDAAGPLSVGLTTKWQDMPSVFAGSKT